MNSKQYIEDAVRTESPTTDALITRVIDPSNIRLLHAGMGLCTEAGEFLDALKKSIFYGKKLDRVNLAEEMGDLFWYLAIAASELGVEFEPIMENNIKKLKARYPEKFTSVDALNRNLTEERKILEEVPLDSGVSGMV